MKNVEVTWDPWLWLLWSGFQVQLFHIFHGIGPVTSAWKSKLNPHGSKERHSPRATCTANSHDASQLSREVRYINQRLWVERVCICMCNSHKISTHFCLLEKVGLWIDFFFVKCIICNGYKIHLLITRQAGFLYWLFFFKIHNFN